MGVVLVVVLVIGFLVLVTGGKQSQHLVLGLRLGVRQKQIQCPLARKTNPANPTPLCTSNTGVPTRRPVEANLTQKTPLKGLLKSKTYVNKS